MSFRSRLKVATPEIATLVSADWWKWLDRFAGLAGHYDVLALHCYAKDGGTTVNYIEKGRWPKWINWLSGLLNLFYPGNQAIKNKLKNIEREKWLTETGWKSNAVGEESQRLYYEDMVNYLENSSVFQKVFFMKLSTIPGPIKNGGCCEAIIRKNRLTSTSNLFERRQRGLDLLAIRLQPGRQD